MPMTKYITMLQGWQYDFARMFEKQFKIKAQPIGYTDSSTTTYTWRVSTKKSVREVQDMVWSLNDGNWAMVTESDPRHA